MRCAGILMVGFVPRSVTMLDSAVKNWRKKGPYICFLIPVYISSVFLINVALSASMVMITFPSLSLL